MRSTPDTTWSACTWRCPPRRARCAPGPRGCCSKEDAGDARRAADVLGIPFYVWDFADRFKEDVIDDFVASYAAGETPNPCLRCNEKIKFAALADRAIALGFDAVATGHYARLEDGVLRRAVDADKDQSYVLGVLTAEQLSRAMFPVGDTPKPQIREEAAERGLAVANKPDSHDICFIPSGDTRAFLGAQHRCPARASVVDADSGEVLAEHDGVHGFTIGQRKGLGVAGSGRRRPARGTSPPSNPRPAPSRVGSAERPAGAGRSRPSARSGPPARAPTGPGRVRGAGPGARRTGARPSPRPVDGGLRRPACGSR